MNPSKEIDRLLEQSGAVLVRHKKHLVYRLPSGTTYTRAKTASDHRAERNSLGILRHALGSSANGSSALSMWTLRSWAAASASSLSCVDSSDAMAASMRCFRDSAPWGAGTGVDAAAEAGGVVVGSDSISLFSLWFGLVAEDPSAWRKMPRLFLSAR